MNGKGKFGMFARRYYRDVPGKPGVRAVTPPPVVGQVYEYIPMDLFSGCFGEPTLGVFEGFSAFGPATFKPVMNTCQFCQDPVFTDDREVGSVRQADGSLKHYHLECLYSKYPNENNYNSLVLKLFSPNPTAAAKRMVENYTE